VERQSRALSAGSAIFEAGVFKFGFRVLLGFDKNDSEITRNDDTLLLRRLIGRKVRG
jgi:hypothetical protein